MGFVASGPSGTRAASTGGETRRGRPPEVCGSECGAGALMGAPAASCQRNARDAAAALGRNRQALPLRGFYHRELALMSPTDCADWAVPVPPATSSRLESDSEAFGFGGRTK